MTDNKPELTTIQTAQSSISIAVRTYPGNGPDVLMIHGIGSSSADFNPVISAMQGFCRPITIDLRGHGASSRPNAGYHYRDYISDLKAVISTLGLQHPIVLGHSLGGIITLMWAATNPVAPRALVIEDSPLRSGVDFGDAFDGWLTLNALSHEAAKAWYGDKNPHWSEDLVNQRAFDMVNTARPAIEELRDASLSNEGLDSFASLGVITAPLLFLQGDPEAGSMVNESDLSSLQELLPQMQVQQFPGAGHTIHRSHPDEWLKRVKQFIEGLER